MAVIKYKKYQILLHKDSCKVQGLHVGDIVRRQYFDGKRTIYSLMCVLDSGVEHTVKPGTGETQDRAYFTGALLEGDAPKSNELLDFARITNLYNIDRSGALYLTSNDDNSPFMDVIDNVGRTESLSWPEDIATDDYQDSQSQYIVEGEGLRAGYTPSEGDKNRVLTVTRVNDNKGVFEGLQQDFYQYVKNPDRILISYKIRSTKPLSANMWIGYTDNLKKDGQWTEDITSEWEYKFHVVSVDYSGRHLRSFKIDMSSLEMGEGIQISDLNIILLSSIANFGKFTHARIGKLSGVSDSVFGQLDGYGAYVQKLYASCSTHISGTLTAGDENGFAATFYAGKIHRNAFLNSMDIPIASGDISANDTDLNNITGIGHVYKSSGEFVIKAQSSEWLLQHVGKRYCFSVWVYAKKACLVEFSQNDKIIGATRIEIGQTYEWRRLHFQFNLQSGQTDLDNMLIRINPQFINVEEESIGNESGFYITAPQLEAGSFVTQYQPTDGVLNYGGGYGAWFARGGIGGTIQNPLLRLNSDGSISSADDSFHIKPDGTGYFADGRFSWNKDSINLKDFKIKWEDLDTSAQSEMKPKSIDIVGGSCFLVGRDYYEPELIELNVQENNFTTEPANYVWYYKDKNGDFSILKQGAKSVTIKPDEYYWEETNTLLLKCAVNFNQNFIISTITIQRTHQGEDSFSVQITTSNGNTFKNGVGTTELVAHVYRGSEDITDTLFPKDFDWIRTSSNSEGDIIFNQAHLGWGNKLVITSDDVWNMAQFDCQVRIN